MSSSYDNGELQELLSCYITSRCSKTLLALHTAMLPACMVLLKSYCKKRALVLSKIQMEETAYNAVMRFTEFLLKPDDQRKQPLTPELPIAGRLNNEILYALHNARVQRSDNTLSLDDDIAIPTQDNDQPEKVEYLQDVLNDSRVDGRRIIIDLAGSKYYRSAIKRIAVYTSKQWMYNNATQLHTIFQNTRRPQQ
jgi:hypothetical protein